MNERSVERRRHARSEVPATAVVFSSDRLQGTFAVEDLSAGGARLVGDPAIERDERLTLVLQLPGLSGLSVSARVIRRERGHARGPRTAVAFVDLSPEEEDRIHEAIVAALERDSARRAATILVLDPDGESRGALERDLRALGHEAVCTSTPLEALGWLEQPDTRIETIVIDLTPGPGHGLDVLEFVGQHHPHIRRIVMAEPFRVDLAVRSGRAHQALSKPWDRERLVAALARAQ